MALHLLKLCVGAESIADLEAWISERLRDTARFPRGHSHITRMMPKRRADLIDGGSLYWVIKGEIAARQAVRDLEPFVNEAGIGRCRILLDATVVPVLPRPCAAFQGWRYLKPDDAPPDAASLGQDFSDMPDGLRRELRGLGLL